MPPIRKKPNSSYAKPSGKSGGSMGKVSRGGSRLMSRAGPQDLWWPKAWNERQYRMLLQGYTFEEIDRLEDD